MKTIIILLNFSNESLVALDLAFMLARKTGANIELVHIIGKNMNHKKELPADENKLAIKEKRAFNA